MKKTEIVKDEFEEWANNTFVDYASESVPGHDNRIQRLRFQVCLYGGFKVTLGEKVLYEGNSFVRAANAYNDA